MPSRLRWRSTCSARPLNFTKRLHKYVHAHSFVPTINILVAPFSSPRVLESSSRSTDEGGEMSYDNAVSRPGSRRNLTLLTIGLLIASAFFATPAQAATPRTAEINASDAVNEPGNIAPLFAGYCSITVTYLGIGSSVFGVPGDSSGDPNCRLDQGASSNAVRALQVGLNGACAVSAGLTVDGAFGPATRAALIQAQIKFGVTADGIYGSNTAHAFRWTSSNGTCNSI